MNDIDLHNKIKLLENEIIELKEKLKTYTLIFFATMGLTTIFTNSLSFNNLFYKININNKE